MNKVCINDGNFDLTIGKIYDVRDHLKYFYLVVDDKGSLKEVYKSRFISIEEFRNRKINLILQDEDDLYR